MSPASLALPILPNVLTFLAGAGRRSREAGRRFPDAVPRRGEVAAGIRREELFTAVAGSRRCELFDLSSNVYPFNFVKDER